MTVVRGWIAKTEFEGVVTPLDSIVQQLVAESLCVNSKAHIKKDPTTNTYTYLGNKTECALLVLAGRQNAG